MRLAELVARLPGRGSSGDAALAELVRLAREQPVEVPDADQLLEAWEPIFEELVAAAGGDANAAAVVEPVLAELEASPDWSAVAAAFRRILDGDLDPQLVDNLEEVDASVVTELLQRLPGAPAKETRVSGAGARPA